jgi:hypothetical protein
MQKCGSGVQFEGMSPGTPQHNGHMEHKFTTLFGYICSMLNHANVQGIIRKVVWAKTSGTATLINFAIVTGTKPVAPYMLFYTAKNQRACGFFKKWRSWHYVRAMQAQHQG